MRAHLRYLWYVARHKWFVFLACLDLRVPLHQAIIHDWQKFTPTEWGPYVAFFYGPKPAERDAADDYHGTMIGDAFDRAWLHHQHYGPHHWQHWILRQDDGQIKVLQMPDRFVREMVADWHGAGRAINGANNTVQWYLTHCERIVLHPETRRRVENLLRIPYTHLVAQKQAADG